MKARTRVCYDSLQGQCAVLLLAVLSDLGGRSTKREVMEYIAQQGYFHISAEDQLPLPTAVQDEPRWKLLVVHTAQVCVHGQCIIETDDGSWQLTPEGAQLYSQSVELFRKGTYDPHRCYLWGEEFKKRLLPGYVPDAADRRRPIALYQVMARQLSAVAL